MSQLSYVDYTTNNKTSKFSVENTYDLKFKTMSSQNIGKQCVAYKLENAYDYFMCDLTSTMSTAYGIAYVNIYGNNKDLLYSSIGISTKDTSIPISLNVEGQTILYIEIVNDIDINSTDILMKNPKLLGKLEDK